MICENCGIDHDGSYGSGRFCSKTCSKGFSTKKNREEINKKISLKLKGRPNAHSDETRVIVAEKVRIYRIESTLNKSFDEVGVGTKKKRILLEQDEKCLNCGLSEWMGQKIKFELDHIDGNNKNNVRNNLRVLCPNCHSLTPTWRKKK